MSFLVLLQVDVAHFSSLPPGSCLAGIGLAVPLSSLDFLRHPESKILEPSLDDLSLRLRSNEVAQNAGLEKDKDPKKAQLTFAFISEMVVLISAISRLSCSYFSSRVPLDL
jgi:hypothetical protein